jgi:hypothetical protein
MTFHIINESLNISKLEKFQQRAEDITLPVLLIFENSLFLFQIKAAQFLFDNLIEKNFE